MTMQVRKFFGTSSTRRKDRIGERVVPRFYWAVSIPKSPLQAVGWWRSSGEKVYFKTIPSSTNAFCELEKVKSRSGVGIHSVNPENGNMVRVGPYFGTMYFDPLGECDRETPIEFIPETGRLRIHYPPTLRPFQNHMMKSSAVANAFNAVRRVRREA
jgi:hypothetical protein